MEGLAGRVINGAFAVWWRNLLNFSVLAFLVCLPMVGLQYLLVSSNWAFSQDLDVFTAAYLQSMLVQGIGLVFASLLSAVLTVAVLQDLRGEQASLGDCLARGFARLWAVFIVSIIATIAIVFGFLALIIPGLILLPMLYVATPVVVMEDCSAMEALRRSAQLTEGAKVSFLGAIVGLFIVTLTLSWLTGLAVETVVEDSVVRYVAVRLLTSFFTPLGACAAAVGYFLVRQEREGVDLDTLAAIFD